MRGRFDTIRARILIGLALLMAGLIATAIAGAATLRQMRYAIDQELDALRMSTEVGSGLVTSVLEEIRAAEQYLGSPGDDPRREFQAAAEEAFQHQRRLDGLGGLTVEDRLTVNRVKQLHATIQTEYSIAHALRDLGRDQEAAARAAAVRPQAAELTRLVRDLSQRQAQKAAKVAQRLSADAADRERKLWVFVVALVIAGFFLSRYTVQSVHGPLGRLVTAAERFGAGDLRPVTTGEMPREFRVLADAIQQMGNRLRQIVGDVIGESDRIAGAAGDLSAVSEELAASSSEVSTAMVEISGGADQQRAALTAMGTGLVALRAATGDMADAAERAAKLGEEIRTVADRHRGDVAAAGSVLLNVREVVQTTSNQISQPLECGSPPRPTAKPPPSCRGRRSRWRPAPRHMLRARSRPRPPPNSRARRPRRWRPLPAACCRRPNGCGGWCGDSGCRPPPATVRSWRRRVPPASQAADRGP